MVLDGGSDSLDGPPPSDDDLYSSNTTYTKTASLEGLPKPMPILGAVFGYNQKLFSMIRNNKLNQASLIIKRPLNKDEADALTFWAARQFSIVSYGTPIGVAAGSWRAWASAGTFRFPFYQPSLEKFDPQVFMNPQMAFFRGNKAVLAWHASRAFFYGAAGALIGQMLIGSYSINVATAGERSDPRLRNFMQEARAQALQRRGQLQNQRDIPSGANTRMQTHTYDDARPTASVDMEESGVPSAQVGATTSEREQSQWNRAYPPSSSPKKKFSTESDSQPFDVWDDASPTGGSGVSADTRNSQPAGSAWDRIRRGERPTSETSRGSSTNDSSRGTWSTLQSNAQNGQQAGGSVGDSFTFSSANGERSSSKEEAQQAFDAQVDRERRGGDFNSGGGDQKRW